MSEARAYVWQDDDGSYVAAIREPEQVSLRELYRGSSLREAVMAAWDSIEKGGSLVTFTGVDFGGIT